MASILVNHEIKVLNFVSEIMKLKKEEQDNSNFAFSKAQEQVVSDVLEQGTGSRVFDMKRNKLGQKQSASAIVLPAKSRNYYVNIKAIQFVI